MNYDIERSDDVISSGVKLKDYINDAIDELSSDYINVVDNLSKADDVLSEALKYMRKCRNILLCINQICKTRKKY